MKTDESLEERISAATLELAARFLSVEETNFHEQIKFLGLNPKTDFRHADLSYMDFSHSDLRGFDFTGADLRGTIGVNVRWDSTTKLFDAETADSLFAYAIQRQDYFRSNVEQAERVERLATDYWANTIITIATMLESEKDKAASLQIAKAVFEDTKNSTVRFSILMHMGAVTDSREEQKAFIYNLLAKFGDDPSVLRPALSTLRYQYFNDLDAFNMMVKFLDHSDSQVRSAAVSGVLSSSHFFSSLKEVWDPIVTSTNPMARRALVGRVARRELRDSALLLEDDGVVNYVDYREPLTALRLMSMARRSFNRVTRPEADRLGRRLNFDSQVYDSDEEIERARLIRHSLKFIRDKYSIPFQIYDGEFVK
ncbi:pentapeptide repeat-containing protein [Bradyrhizobium sp. AUGA SZCCT0158]|uniref:pentapeptide repeat-containing protein n=1 Tax=Bradyrhizobium sp. AUGA SZCCT0158 TaxID=2807661 RepID=UPI001BAC555E|nr:pentapeptide repeat-containing protein [Bradyrhizobium sp. AUGA SZCCT0158]MBR1200019.1 pentapeptide repeat-containing protein [Bradyrhizobium sp. AUGA SZCCT0158]